MASPSCFAGVQLQDEIALSSDEVLSSRLSSINVAVEGSDRIPIRFEFFRRELGLKRDLDHNGGASEGDARVRSTRPEPGRSLRSGS